MIAIEERDCSYQNISCDGIWVLVLHLHFMMLGMTTVM